MQARIDAMTLQGEPAQRVPTTIDAKLVARTPSPAPLPAGIPGFGAAQKQLDQAASRREASALRLPDSDSEELLQPQQPSNQEQLPPPAQSEAVHTRDAASSSAPKQDATPPTPSPRAESPAPHADVEADEDLALHAEGMGAPFGLTGVSAAEFI